MKFKSILMFCLMLSPYFLRAQCQNGIEFTRAFDCTATVRFNSSNQEVLDLLGNSYQVIFYQDSLFTEDTLLVAPKLNEWWRASGMLVRSLDKNGQTTWQKNYQVTTETQVNLFKGRVPVYLTGDTLKSIVDLRPGSHNFGNIKYTTDKWCAVVVMIRASNGEIISIKPLIEANSSLYIGLFHHPVWVQDDKGALYAAFSYGDSVWIDGKLFVPENNMKEVLCMLKYDADAHILEHRIVAFRDWDAPQDVISLNNIYLDDHQLYVLLSARYNLKLINGDSISYMSTIGATAMTIFKLSKDSFNMIQQTSIQGIGGIDYSDSYLGNKGVLYVLFTSQTGEFWVGETDRQPSGVYEGTLLSFDKDLKLQHTLRMNRPKGQDSYVQFALIKSQEQIGLNIYTQRRDDDFFIHDKRYVARSIGATSWHIYLDKELNRNRHDVFHSDSFHFIEPINVSSPTILYRGVTTGNINGSISYEFQGYTSRYFHMQKCIKNILNTPEWQTENCTGLYPNPFSNAIQIPEKLMHQTLVISDVLGKIVYQGVPGSSEISTAHWSTGVYWVHVPGYAVQKLIKY